MNKISDYRFKPKSISPAYTMCLEDELVLLGSAYKQVQALGYEFYAVEQTRGRCYYTREVITIPVWVYKRGLDYRIWYMAHEIAHALAFFKYGTKIAAHGKEFMAELKAICPVASLHYETNYKPSNAYAAGISVSKHINMGTVPDDF